MSAFGGPFAAVSTPTSTFFAFDTLFCIILDLFDFVEVRSIIFHDFRRFLAFIADGHGGSPDFALGRISLQADVR